MQQSNADGQLGKAAIFFFYLNFNQFKTSVSNINTDPIIWFLSIKSSKHVKQ